MQKIVFPFFLARLILLNLGFLLKVLFNKHKYLKSSLLVVLTIFFVGLAIFYNIYSKNPNNISGVFSKNTATPEIPLPEFSQKSEVFINTNSDNVETFNLELSPENIEEKLLFYKELHKKQPTHRDVLLNLAILEHEIGNEVLASQYLEQARQLDPNNPVFKTR